ncbi:MAG: SsrA-binding protein SmpB [Flavobacteriales bacterium]|nr:SsrA-binding protein SmpB [Flavobacteriales bacterium]
MKSKPNNINIQNKRASFEYELMDRYTAGIVLYGTEIKSLRLGKGRIAESFCQMSEKGELFVINMNIDQYSHATYFNHAARRERKLLLTRIELRRLARAVKEKGLSIVPLRLFINKDGLAKMEIALARGKKLYDKRESLKQKDATRDIDRARKSF